MPGVRWLFFMKLLKILWLPCLVMTIIVIVCLVAYIIAPASMDWVRNLTLNVITEIFGIVLTIFLIDRVLRAREELDEKEARRKYQTIALRHLRIPLINHLRMFTNILKAVSESAPQKSYGSVHDLFDNDYFTKLELLDFSKDAPLLGYDGLSI